MYWFAAFPDGVSGESMRDVIDIDESNYKLESQNRIRYLGKWLGRDAVMHEVSIRRVRAP